MGARAIETSRIADSSPVQLSRFERLKETRIFSTRFEWLHVGLGIFSVLLSVALVLQNGNVALNHYPKLVNFLSSILFLNITHNAFSFVLPIVCPEVKEWWTKSRHYGLSTTKLMVLFFGLMFFAGATFLACVSLTRFGVQADQALTIFVLIWSTQHVGSQFYGISRMYDQAQPIGSRFPKSLHKQKLMIQAFYGLAIFKAVFIFFQHDSQMVTAEWSLVSSVQGLLLASYLISVLRENRGEISCKFLFSLRLVLVLLFSWGCPWPLFFSVSLHGIEHLFVSGLMVRNSRTKEHSIDAPTSRHWILAGALVLFVCAIYQTRYYVWGTELGLIAPSFIIVIKFLAGLSTAISFAHYVLDHRMFRMREAEAKKYVGPLLRKSE